MKPSVPCPTCHARAGELCRTIVGRQVTRTHKRRKDLLKKKAS